MMIIIIMMIVMMMRMTMMMMRLIMTMLTSSLCKPASSSLSKNVVRHLDVGVGDNLTIFADIFYYNIDIDKLQKFTCKDKEI